MDIKENGWSGIDWVDLAHEGGQGRVLLNIEIHLKFPLNVGEYFSG
jgi:hypothetical protein